MKNNFTYALIAILLVTSIFFFNKSRNLSRRLDLIQKRIEESRAAMEAVPEPYKAKIAIVIDDLGYNLNNVGEIWALNVPVTLSILPSLSYSKKIAQMAAKKNIEVILHLPLEPHENLRLEKDTIMTSMTDEEIKASLDKSILSIPGLKGVSGHMGSKATEDKRVMSVVLNDLKVRELYFLDSLVTSGSICSELSRSLGVKSASRSIFLDNEADSVYIRGQLTKLIKRALAADHAIGIGHDRALTIAAIREMLPKLEEMRVEVVSLSELVE